MMVEKEDRKERLVEEEAPRVKREVKEFGSGGAHVTIPRSVADVGDEVLVINLEKEEK